MTKGTLNTSCSHLRDTREEGCHLTSLFCIRTHSSYWECVSKLCLSNHTILSHEAGLRHSAVQKALCSAPCELIYAILQPGDGFRRYVLSVPSYRRRKGGSGKWLLRSQGQGQEETDRLTPKPCLLHHTTLSNVTLETEGTKATTAPVPSYLV